MRVKALFHSISINCILHLMKFDREKNSTNCVKTLRDSSPKRVYQKGMGMEAEHFSRVS